MLLSNREINIDNIRTFTESAIQSGKGSELLTIVPTNRKARRTKKEFISLSPRKTLSVINIETLTTFATKLLELKQDFHPLDDATSSYILKQSADLITPVYFKHYKENVFPQGTLEKIKAVISEYKRTGITPEKLLAEVSENSAGETERKKALDIASIYSIYSEKCNNLKALEIGDIYRSLLELSDDELAESFSSLFPEVQVITLTYFREISIPEVELLKKVSDAAGLSVIAHFDYSESNRLIFEAIQPTIERLVSAGFNVAGNEEKESSQLLNFLKRRLFLPSIGKQPEPSKSIVLFNGKDKVEELERIVKIIKKIISVENVSPSRIAVVFNLIEEYSPLLRIVFESHGIPFNLSDRLTLDKSPVINALTSFLEISESGFYYKNIFKGLSSGYVSKLGIDVYNLQKIFQKHKLISGYEFITKVLKEIINSIPDSRKYEKEETKRALSDIIKIKSILSTFEKEQTADEFFEEIKSLIKKIGIFDTLINNLAAKGEENIKAVSSLLESIESVFELIKEEFGAETKHSLSFFINQLRTIIGWVRFNVKERSDYGVQVTSVDEIRGLEFDYVFVGGMNDGSFPSKYSPEIFFAEKFMKLESEHLSEERYKFYTLFKRFRKRLFISFALTENKRELAPSVFLSDLSEIITPVVPDDSFFNSAITSRTDLLIQFGKGNIDGLSDILDLNKEETLRKIDVSKQRSEVSDSVYEGNLSSELYNDFPLTEKSLELLSSFKEKKFSITQFEQYAKCPFKYFTERVLKIEPIQEPNDEIEPIEIGKFLHSLLFEFYTTLLERKIDIHDAEAETLLFDLAEALIQTYRFEDESYFYEKEKFFGIAGKRKDSILYHFLEEERNSSDGFIPQYFEVSFGTADKAQPDRRLSIPVPILYNGIKLIGKIDRIELNKNFISIVDYKTGASKVENKNLEEGIDLQLPVYMFAAEELLGPGFEPGKMNIYSLKFNDKAFGKKEIYSGTKGKKKLSPEAKSERLKNLIETSLTKIEGYYNNIVSGRFEPSLLNEREKLVCNYCELRTICRVDERENE